MPDIEEWWERSYPSDHRGKEHPRLRPTRRPRPSNHLHGETDPPRIRSPDDFSSLIQSAERLRQQDRDRPRPRPEPKLLRHLAHVCQQRGDLLRGNLRGVYSGALIALSAHWRDWVRPPDSWKPTEDDADARFGGLARHLLAVHEVPRVLDAAWRAGLSPEGVRYQGWFKHVGRGRNLRTVDDLPLPLSKRMAHAFTEAPADLEIPMALRWAQVRSLGADSNLAGSLVRSRIGTDFHRDDFWLTVIRWFINHPEIRPGECQPIVDYLYHQKFVPSVPNPSSRLRGRSRQPLLVPPRPNLCIKGRTPSALRRAVEQWHLQLGNARRGLGQEWPPSGLPPFVHEEGEGADRRIHALTELISSDELEEEGQAMRHCVADYWLLCQAGQTSIWSLTTEDAGGRVERLLTVQVHLGARTIIQARGHGNRRPDTGELAMLERWGKSGGPALCASLP